MTSDFMECAACASKPGMPMLCKSCLHNRAVIDNFRTTINYETPSPENAKEIRKMIEKAKNEPVHIFPMAQKRDQKVIVIQYECDNMKSKHEANQAAIGLVQTGFTGIGLVTPDDLKIFGIDPDLVDVRIVEVAENAPQDSFVVVERKPE